MIVDWFVNLNHVHQALLATLFTWFVTALGAGLVFFFKTINRVILDGMLGFCGRCYDRGQFLVSACSGDRNGG